jgi:hypothetical protein
MLALWGLGCLNTFLDKEILKEKPTFFAFSQKKWVKLNVQHKKTGLFPLGDLLSVGASSHGWPFLFPFKS